MFEINKETASFNVQRTSFMQSGNFLVGKYGLTLEGFAKYIEPQLILRKCKITDRVSVLYDRNLQKGNVLVSLASEKGLVNILGESLKEAGDIASTDIDLIRKENPSAELLAFPHQIDFYEVLGLYSKQETASKIFPIFALQYLGKNAEQGIASLETRLRELLGKTISSLLH